jgi:hypothetical protein
MIKVDISPSMIGSRKYKWQLMSVISNFERWWLKDKKCQAMKRTF